MSVPPGEVRRWQPPPPPRRPARRRVAWYERFSLWWLRHAWVPVWIAVFVTPAVLLGLRLIDDTELGLIVPPLLIAGIVLFLAMVGIAVRGSLPRSLPRALGGAVSAVVAVTLLTLPMIHVIGQRACPERMGADRGADVSMQMLEAWRRGEPAQADVWASAAVADAWKARTEGTTLLEYRLVDSGCWERLSPVTTKRTWHEFRVVVQRGEDEHYSKMVTVHTGAARDGWRIAEVDGPEPN